MRDQGEGIPRMFEEMESSFLYLPVLEVIGGRFRVALRNEPIANVDDPAWSRAVRSLPISITQKRAMLGFDRMFANSDYGELNVVERDVAYRELNELVEHGFMEAIGSGSATRYRVVRASVPTAAPATAMTPLDHLVTRMNQVGFITNTDYRDAFGVSRDVAKIALARWAGEGMLVREGEKRGTRYRAGSTWPRPSGSDDFGVRNPENGGRAV